MSVITFLASGSFFGGGFGDILNKWQEAGVFSYVLPFLLIFALVFGILTKMSLLGENKPVNAIISLAIGLMALQFDFVPRFFSEIFPRLGIGLSILLALLILTGLFWSNEDSQTAWFKFVLLVAGFIIVVVTVINTAGSLGWSAGYWWEDHWISVLGVIVLLVLIGWLVAAGGGSKKK
jgi:hypothetical protein